jgi:hypothetical protein
MTEENDKNRVTVTVVGSISTSDMPTVLPGAQTITLRWPLIGLLYDLKEADAAGCEKVVVPIPAGMPDMDSDSITAIGVSARIFVDSKPSSVRSIVFMVAGNPVAFKAILDMLKPSHCPLAVALVRMELNI